MADTLGVKKHQEDNEKMIEIGNRVGIHTVYEKNDISNIGNTLWSILKNKLMKGDFLMSYIPKPIDTSDINLLKSLPLQKE